ncbi:unnamed protein product [Mytilus coruscus]|uniref:Uncharacterized protein n=1 Tax=Mytilus coruscus TaxID=42192 RepID=A0A6J8B3T2_MYTCO|nr:unnamed protein product [Mytilus coruscus]
MDTNLVFLVFTLYSLIQGGDLDIALCDARQWYLKSAAEGLFDGPLSGSQESVQYEIEDILLKSRNDQKKRQIDCILLEQFEDILKKKSKRNEGDNGEAVNEMEIDETDILEEDIEHDETDQIEHNKAEQNQEMDKTNSLPDEATHSSHLQSNSHGEISNASEDRDSKNAEEISNVEQSKEQKVFQEIEENEQNTIDQNSDQLKTTKLNDENRAAEYNGAQLQTTEHNEEQQHTMGQNEEQPQTSEQNGTNIQKEQNEEQQKTTEQIEHNEEEQRKTVHIVENQQTTEQIEEQTTNQSKDQKQTTEQGRVQQQIPEHGEEEQQQLTEQIEEQTANQSKDQKQTTEQGRVQQQIPEHGEEEQQQLTEQIEEQTTNQSKDQKQTTEQGRVQQQIPEHGEEEQQQLTEQIEEQTTNQSKDQKQTTEQGRVQQQIPEHGEEQQQITEQGEKQQHITEQNEGQTQTTDQNVIQKKTTEQSEDQPQMMEQNSKTQTTERNDESQTTEQNRARPQAMEQNEFQSDYIDLIIADLFPAEDASEKDNAAKTGSLSIEQTMSIQTQQNGENGDSQTHALQDKAVFSDLTKEKEKYQEMQADKTVQTAEHLKTEMHETAKGTEKHMEKENDKMMSTADDQTTTTEQHKDASSETKPTDNIANTEHLKNVNDFDSESDYSDAEKEKNLQIFGVCNTDTSSVTDIFLSRYLPSIQTNNESTTEKCRDCHGFVSDYTNSDRASNVNTDMPDEFSDKDFSKHESPAPNKELGQKDNTHDKIDTVNPQNDNNKQSENIRTTDTHPRVSQEHTYSMHKDSIPSYLVPSNENTNDEEYVVNRENEPASDNNLQQTSVKPDDKTNDKEEIVNKMQDANFEHMKEFFKTKTLEYSSQIQNLEILVIKLQNQLLMEKLDKQNHSTSITRLENSILKLENELLRLNNSHYDLKIENEKMNRQKQKYLQLDHVPKNDSKQAKEITDQTSKSYEIITQQQSKITQLAELLKNQSKAIQHMKTRYDYLEDQNRMLFQMVMNQTSLMTQIMSRVQELSDQNMQHRIEAQSLKEKLAMSKLSDKKENNHFSEVSNKLLEKIDAIVSDKKIDMTDDRKSKTNNQETGKFGNEDEADEKLKDYINKTKKLADITYNWCGKHRMVCIYKSIRLSTCVPFVPLYWSVCEERQTKDTTRPQMEYGYDRRKTVKQDLEELKEQIFNKVKAQPSAEDPKDRNEEKADKNIKNDDTKSHAFVQGSENEIVEISKQSTDSKPQTSDVDKKAIEENVETKPLKPTADETTKIKTTDTKTQMGNGKSTEIKTFTTGCSVRKYNFS